MAFSVSLTDITHILRLDLESDTEILSDKLVRNMSEDYLRERFGGRNLLVIGSPAVNIVSRLVNQQSIFRFVLSESAKSFEQEFGKFSDVMAFDPDLRRVFAEMIGERNPGEISWQHYFRKYPKGTKEENESWKRRLKELAEETKEFLGGMNAKAWMNEFRKAGFIDLTGPHIHGTVVGANKDFGVISISSHPWNKDRVCIFAAGIHGPGTLHAVKALADESFEGRPFGGIFELQLAMQDAWPDIIGRPQFKWETGEYTVKDLTSNAKNIRNIKTREARDIAKIMGEDLGRCVEFLSRFRSTSQ